MGAFQSARQTVTDTVRDTLGKQSHEEGRMARAIEEQTAKLPSDLFLWAAGASILTSLAARVIGRQHTSLFVGQWAPTLLILGLYNKLVKLQGHDRMS
jgi:hypothetical protein